MNTPDQDFDAQVERFLEEKINPLLASHGGFVRLDHTEGADIYLELGGGCQGCPGARATMRHGIEAALREHIPGVGEVIDATDHGAASAPWSNGR